MIWPKQTTNGVNANIWQSRVGPGENYVADPITDLIPLDMALSVSDNADKDSSRSRGNKAVCRFFQNNTCTMGEECKFSHSVPESEVQIGEQQYSVCEICCEDVFAKGSKFGLLDNCDHVFCLDCIREWRNQKFGQDRLNLRKCPICRLDSFVIIPSSVFLIGKDKLLEKQKYTSHLAQIPCRNFSLKGNCQFGSSCMYAHVTDERVNGVCGEFKMIAGADGKKTKSSGVQLSNFLK